LKNLILGLDDEGAGKMERKARSGAEKERQI